MIFKRQILFPVFLLLAKFVIAQGGTTIKASVDKSKILIGEPLKLTIEAYLSPESVKNFISIDSIKHFEFVDKPIIDTMDKRGGGILKVSTPSPALIQDNGLFLLFYFRMMLRVTVYPLRWSFLILIPIRNIMI